MKEDKVKEGDTRTTIHPAGAGEVEGAECLVGGPEGRLEEAAVVILTTVTRTMRSIMITDLVEDLRGWFNSTEHNLWQT